MTRIGPPRIKQIVLTALLAAGAIVAATPWDAAAARAFAIFSCRGDTSTTPDSHRVEFISPATLAVDLGISETTPCTTAIEALEAAGYKLTKDIAPFAGGANPDRFTLIFIMK